MMSSRDYGIRVYMTVARKKKIMAHVALASVYSFEFP